MSIYVPKHFRIYELVPKQEYWKHVDRGAALWWMFDRNLLITLDKLRNKFGKMVINDWYWQGENQYRGWRPMDILLGSSLSQHKFGRAADLIPMDTTADAIRFYIRTHPEQFPLLSAVEDDVSWLHVDTRNWDRTRDGILFFKA